MNIVKKLVDKHEITKYRISKVVRVSWATVQFWYKGVFKPNDEHKIILEEYYKQITG